MTNKSVTIIPATKRVGSLNSSVDETPKLRVAAYCRVSTDSEEQASSYEVQVAHYTKFINDNSEWELAGIYADDGISGTSTKNREEFNRLIKDCNDNKIDRIITKSISRFARNTVDCLNYIRKLKEKNIAIYFEKENIDTLDSKGEIMITIMASLAQQESQSLSQNVKLGLQYRYQQGEMSINHNRFLGYTKDEEGNLVIEPDEAEVIKRIFKEYLDGGSLIKIAKGLESDGILTGAGKKRWTGNTVKGILKNEKYMGDALLAKTYTVDFLSKKRVKNDGIVPQYYVENSHEAIIPKSIFLQVQEELSRRSKLKKQKGTMNYSSKYALSGICFCSHCGDTYRRIHWANRGNKIIVWRCHKCLEKNQTCDSRTIKEEVLKNAVVKAIQDVFIDSDKIKEMLTKSINKILSSENYDEITSIDTKLEELQEKLITFSSQSNEINEIGEQILILKEQKQQLLLNSVNKDTSTQRMEEMIEFLDNQKKNSIEYDEIMVRRLVEKITIYDEYISIKFKSGIEIVVEE